MLIFSTPQLLLDLQEACRPCDLKKGHGQEDHVFSDGTFKMSPTPFKQIYVIRAKSDKVYVTMAYVLLTNKKEEQYVKMFRQLQLMCHGFQIHNLMIDFENGVRYVPSSFFSCKRTHYCYTK